MTTWNYRVIKTRDQDDTVYQIAEVYYSDDGDIEYWSASAEPATGECPEGLRDDLMHQLEALGKPVLTEHDDGGRITLVEAL